MPGAVGTQRSGRTQAGGGKMAKAAMWKISPQGEEGEWGGGGGEVVTERPAQAKSQAGERPVDLRR